ncbi:MAG: hypothetical protein IAB08_08365 [Bacteroidetes bacterium]|uniref:Uncharacterized protein n=1 Tax=Candidatus Pullibacteroides excrementavium TaxID=2840905 RepID=A0A9D9DW87_9BACT|nr:hypothetical protein [Candidatus Pullibacteroides excrementavium]
MPAKYNNDYQLVASSCIALPLPLPKPIKPADATSAKASAKVRFPSCILLICNRAFGVLQKSLQENPKKTFLRAEETVNQQMHCGKVKSPLFLRGEMKLLFRRCLKFLAILKRLNFQGPVSGFCLPIGGYFGSCWRFSRPIAGLSFFENAAKGRHDKSPNRCEVSLTGS